MSRLTVLELVATLVCANVFCLDLRFWNFDDPRLRQRSLFRLTTFELLPPSFGPAFAVSTHGFGTFASLVGANVRCLSRLTVLEFLRPSLGLSRSCFLVVLPPCFPIPARTNKGLRNGVRLLNAIVTMHLDFSRDNVLICKFDYVVVACKWVGV